MYLSPPAETNWPGWHTTVASLWLMQPRARSKYCCQPSMPSIQIVAQIKHFYLTCDHRVTQLTTEHLPLLSVLYVSPTEIVVAVSIL